MVVVATRRHAGKADAVGLTRPPTYPVFVMDGRDLHWHAAPAPLARDRRSRNPALRRAVPSPLPRISAYFGNGAST